MNRASINFWQDENLFGQVSRKLGWMITTSNPVRKEYRQRQKAEVADNQEWEASDELKRWAPHIHSWRRALDKLVVPHLPRAVLVEAVRKLGNTLSAAVFLALMYWSLGTGKAGSCWWQKWVHCQFATPMVRLLPKKMSKSRECDGTARHINSISPPSPSSSTSKKPDSLSLSPELCSFSTKDQLHLHLLSGQTLHCLWNKCFFQGGSQGSESQPCCMDWPWPAAVILSMGSYTHVLVP